MLHALLTPLRAHSSCAERDEWHSCLSRALPEDYKAQALAAFHHSVEVSGGPETHLTSASQPGVSQGTHTPRRTLSSSFRAPPPTPSTTSPMAGQSLCSPSTAPPDGSVSDPRLASWRMQWGGGCCGIRTHPHVHTLYRKEGTHLAIS